MDKFVIGVNLLTTNVIKTFLYHAAMITLDQITIKQYAQTNMQKVTVTNIALNLTTLSSTTWFGSL